MLQHNTIDPHTLELLNFLMQKSYLSDFVLVGGTALALQIGHRKSIDIDLFCAKEFDIENILRKINTEFAAVFLSAKTIQSAMLIIAGVKVDLIKFSYPLLFPIVEWEGIRMLSIQDIAAMKLSAVAGRGSKKDFYDIYYLLQHFSIQELFDFHLKKYGQNGLHLLRSLIYFLDADEEPTPYLFDKKLTWNKVKKQIIKFAQQI